jgi:hypothetical protein
MVIFSRSMRVITVVSAITHSNRTNSNALKNINNRLGNNENLILLNSTSGSVALISEPTSDSDYFSGYAARTGGR